MNDKDRDDERFEALQKKLAETESERDRWRAQALRMRLEISGLRTQLQRRGIK